MGGDEIGNLQAELAGVEGFSVTNAQLAQFMDFMLAEQSGDAWDTIPKIVDAMRERSEALSVAGFHRRAVVMISLADIVDRFCNRVAIGYMGSSLAAAFMSVADGEQTAASLAVKMHTGVREFEQRAGLETSAIVEARELAGSFLCALAVWNAECDPDIRAMQYSPQLDKAVECLGWRDKWPRLSRFCDSIRSKMVPTSELLPPEQMEFAL